jgi:hypothetical protein
MPVKLDSIVPWGRSFDEYVRMFALTESDLAQSILDCAAGPSSFGAEMHERGWRVVCVDPIYEFSADEIRARVHAVRETMIDQVREQRAQFVWNYIRSTEHLADVRLGAMELFLKDFETATGDRYIAKSLPDLPPGDFDLALCSHFLFLYSDRLSAEFHVECIGAILGVAKEVRIFPVTSLSGDESPHLQDVRQTFESELVPVSYEFLRGANRMLKIHRRASDLARR